MNEARDHHYVPEFYLKRWATKGSNSQLREFSRPYKGRLYSRWRPPSGTAYKRDLYTVDVGPGVTPVALETEYFAKLDDLASKATDAIAANRALKGDESSSLTQFILSLLLRDPETIAVLREATATAFRATLEVLQPLYERRRHEIDGPERLGDFMRESLQYFLNTTFFTMTHSLISSESMYTLFTKLHWHVLQTSAEADELLTSDTPVICGGNGLINERSYIALPVTPRHLAIGTGSEAMMRDLMSLRPDRLVGLLNDEVIGQAVKFVYSTDAAQSRFIDNRMGKRRTATLQQRFRKAISRERVIQADPDSLLDVLFMQAKARKAERPGG